MPPTQSHGRGTDAHPTNERLRDERGQAAPLALVAVVIAVVVTFAIASLGRSIVDAGRARTAADAAALAGVEGSRDGSAGSRPSMEPRC